MDDAVVFGRLLFRRRHRVWLNAAVCLLRLASVFLDVGLQNIVDRVVRAYGAEVSGPMQEKLFNYIRLRASTGIPDEKLLMFGRAYLREILKPNPRYTGC